MRLRPALIALAVLCASSCERLEAVAPVLGCGPAGLAELRAVDGQVSRDFAAQLEQWKAAPVGASFDEGDGLRTGSGAGAELRVGGGGKVVVESDTTIRFFSSVREGGDKTAGIDVEAGQAVVEAGDAELSLQTQLGTAVLRAGTRVRLQGDGRGQRYAVELGGATIQHSDGSTQTLEKGQSVSVGIGQAVLDDGTPDAGAAAAKPAAATGAEGEAQQAAAELGPDQVAASVQGKVRRRASGEDDWSSVLAGPTRFDAGDELKVGKGAQAQLRRGKQRATLREGHYRVGGADDALVEALDGTLQVTTDDGDLKVQVPGGAIIARGVDGGSGAKLVVGDDGSTRVEVTRGSVEAQDGSGSQSLGAGDRATLGASADSEGEASEAEVAAKAESGEPQHYGEGMAYSEVRVPVGETFRVYDPKPPTVVGFKTTAVCAGRPALVRVSGSEPVLTSRWANVSITPGRHGYTVHCMENGRPAKKVVARGAVRVVRNSGLSTLPQTAPRNQVETDGRRYTLMYQNLKPIVDVRWKGAPKASGYVLHLVPASGAARKFKTKAPRFTVKSSMLRDGSSKIFFETSDKVRKRSKQTTIDVVFDNAAPTASLKLPPPSGFGGGGKVKVAGVAVAGSQVSVEGKVLKLGAGHRFSQDIPLRADQRAIAVRFQHARHGIRYYLRRKRP
ncbi:MAG: hypothetical protein OEZ06_27330 [Myxococcales bacterium]|nr:hypothetical protein [Myxococcales bacterium]